ncbi:hypothetical protein SASPL_114016 [Salvia splendens]|uniref:eIF-4F 25 kDa subunit n=1 Tax=Salvia splendens TaxID=180675 RepID=A0A8X8XZX2_SALSN|nr:hypothetical protein SASPL_114016 [Salvia splendens]
MVATGLLVSLGENLILLLALIGEQFDNGDEICGAVVNVRARQDKIALWTKNATNEAAQVCLILNEFQAYMMFIIIVIGNFDR